MTDTSAIPNRVWEVVHVGTMHDVMTSEAAVNGQIWTAIQRALELLKDAGMVSDPNDLSRSIPYLSRLAEGGIVRGGQVTPTDLSALRALQEAARAANGAWGPHHRPDVDYRTALVNAAPDLLDELDQLREQVAPCDGGCDYSSGPEETCSLHGRKVAEVWKIVEQLQGQVARVDNIRKSLEDAGMTVTRQHGSEMPSEWVEWVNAPVDSVLGIIGQALAIPAEPAGVSRESIEQVRWAEANPNAVALDEVEAKRRDTAEGGE